MKILFKNIKKNTLPLLVNVNISFEDYFNNLTPSSKRFFNLSYRLYDNEIDIKIDEKYPIDERINYSNRISFISNKFFNSKNNINEDLYLNFFSKKNKLIAYNILSITKSKKIIGYCNCLDILDEKYFIERNFNIYTWFKSIEKIIKEGKLNFIDLVVDKQIYNYFRIKNDIEYDLENIETSKSYTLKRNKSENAFNEKNSSKFLFLTKEDKENQKDVISVVCRICNTKNIINVYNEINNCSECLKILSKLI